MARLLLVRHGDTEYNADRRFMGHSDIELSLKGRHQIERLRDYILSEVVTTIYASDLLRTMATAEIINGSRDLQIIPCPELREMHYGACEGLTFNEIGRDFPLVAEQCRYFTPDLEFPKGETFKNFASRVITFVDRLNKHPPREVVLVVTHNGPIKVLICHLLRIGMEHWWQVRTDTASLSIVDTTPRGAVLTRLNDTSFLSDAPHPLP